MKTERRTAHAGATTAPGNAKALRQPSFLIAAGILLIFLCWTYSNHFENPFHFDDSHTIVNNTAIRDLKNTPRFFSDATTSSTLPANQAWRPGVTLLNAVDFAVQKKMGEAAQKDTTGFAATVEKKLSPKWWAANRFAPASAIMNPLFFHLSIFTSYLILGVLLFFFFLHIFKISFPAISYSHWAALIGTGWFMLHTANAETINYIIARADSFSTMMVLLAFVLYFYSAASRKFHLYLLPIFLGFFVKEPTIMFAPMLVVFVWLFGEPRKNSKAALFQTGLAFLLAIILYIVSRKMTPPNWTSGGGDPLYYLATETFVILHYFCNFILPISLSADTDWQPVTTFFDGRVFIGVLFILVLLWIAWKCSKKQNTKPISFGILWFFIALAPTSSIFSFSEVLNDHRTFFPYIGLVLAFVCTGILLLEKAKEKNAAAFVKPALLTLSCVLLVSHAIGTHHRNVVWSSGKTLWKDVTEKSPKNGRGWMNYGLALMGDNQHPNMDSAIICFNQALTLYPGYSYAHINMGIAQSRLGNEVVAEQHYKQALATDPLNPECYYFYGLYLAKMQRVDESRSILKQGHDISPQHEGINYALNSMQNFKTTVEIAQDAVQKDASAENYVNLSLALYNNQKFKESVSAAKEAARIKPDYVIAWNNICAAYNKLGEWDSAMVAGKRATEIKPDDQLSKANYSFAVSSKMHFDTVETNIKKHPEYNALINLSLEWYRAGNYHKAIDAAQRATQINPNDVLGWNNICASANQLGNWDLAISSGEKAVQVNPDFVQARNNLAEAKKGKAEGGKR